MAVWVVRGGRNGEREEEALANGRLTIGFGLTPELTDDLTFENVWELVRGGRPDRGKGTITRWTNQIWNFRHSIKIGDLIVMPLKQNETIAVGEMVGDYKYRPEAGPEFIHSRAVKWINKSVPRPKVSSGLEITFRKQMTVINISEHTEEIAGFLGEKPNGSSTPWDVFISWAKLFYEWELFNEQERSYKLEVGQNVAAVKEAFSARDSDWERRLQQTLQHPYTTNLVDWRTTDGFTKLDRPQREKGLRGIWGADTSASLEDRIRHFLDIGPIEVNGRRTSFAPLTSLIALLLMADDATQYPMYGYSVLKTAYQLTEYPSDPNDSSDVWERYEHMLGFYDRFIKEAYSRGLQVRDRLDAQALTWCVAHYEPLEEWPLEVQEKFKVYQQGESVAPPDSPATEPSPPPQDPWSQPNITALADNLLWEPRSKLQEIIQDLKDKRQVIFYGPPGTGKTYVAREIAKQCCLDGGDFEIVQFHPSYSYEDFVEGFRPKLHDGRPGFELVPGPLRRIADRARNSPNSTFILVIDELNRGNVAKVFGELYFLLEYRNEEVRLQYGGGAGFSLPKNLWFICTMNTADRSIALMDGALRRRFYFAPFFPDASPIKGLLSRWLDREGQPPWVADLVDKANEKLDRDTGIGPSHFMRVGDTLDESRVRRIWDRAVLPYVEEQCFGDEEKLKGFDFDHLKGQLNDVTLSDVGPAEGAEEAQGGDADPDFTWIPGMHR